VRSASYDYRQTKHKTTHAALNEPHTWITAQSSRHIHTTHERWLLSTGYGQPADWPLPVIMTTKRYTRAPLLELGFCNEIKIPLHFTSGVLPYVDYLAQDPGYRAPPASTVNSAKEAEIASLPRWKISYSGWKDVCDVTNNLFSRLNSQIQIHDYTKTNYYQSWYAQHYWLLSHHRVDVTVKCVPAWYHRLIQRGGGTSAPCSLLRNSNHTLLENTTVEQLQGTRIRS